MARVIFSPLVSEVAGSAGSATFQRSMGGHTLRSKPLNYSAPTPSQVVSRMYMSKVIAAWGGLSDAQRLAWAQFAAYAPVRSWYEASKYLSGYSLFVRYNLLRLHTKLSMLLAPSYSSGLDTDFTWWLVYGSGQTFISFSETINPATRWFMLKLTLPRWNNVSHPVNELRIIAPTVASSSQISIIIAYYNVFHIYLSSGKILYAELTMFSTVSAVISYYRPLMLTVQ